MATREAPRYLVPDVYICSVEHPGVIESRDRACASLGGKGAIQESLLRGLRNRPLGLQLHYGDVYRRPTFAQETDTANVLLKVTVPKRTGRKRKCGNHEILDTVSQKMPRTLSPTSISHLLRSLRDNAGRISVQAQGNITETFRFRGLPDFQYSLISSQIAGNFKQNILSFDAGKLKDFHLRPNVQAKAEATDMIPPPLFTTNSFLFLYGYSQNASVKKVINAEGKQTTINSQTLPKIGAAGIIHSAKEVPSAPDASLPAIEELEESVQKVIYEMRHILESRPIVTRRALLNQLGREALYDLRWASQYCAYTFLSGPWRDTMVRFGVDPRKNPDMRKYQTVSVKLLARADHGEGVVVPAWRQSKAATAGLHKDSHIFDGKTVVRDGSVWQLCDITDPQLAQIVNTQPRDVCDTGTWGWYYEVSFAKLQAIMREKIRTLLRGDEPDDAAYINVLKMPDTLEELNARWDYDSIQEGREKRLCTSIRNTAELSRSNQRGGLRPLDGPLVPERAQQDFQRSSLPGESGVDLDEASDNLEIVDHS